MYSKITKSHTSKSSNRFNKFYFHRTAVCSNSIEVCCPFENIKHQKIPQSSHTVLVHKKCGIRRNKIHERIQTAEDSEAELGEFPWIVSIFSTIMDPMEYMCGGSLIHPEVVVTVAHCLRGGKKLLNKWLVRSGDHDQQSEQEIVPHQDRRVAEIKKHSNFSQGTLINDIALVFLVSPFELKNHINLICIPTITTSVKDQKCFAAGWGRLLKPFNFINVD